MSGRPTPEVIGSARAGAKATGIPASVTIAQWALESGWGKHQPGNNPFGIKAMHGYTSQMLPTHEYIHGHMVPAEAPFAVFPDLATAFLVHDKLLKNAACYAPARAVLPNIFAFVGKLTGVYATDPNYGTLLTRIILDSNLTQYDDA